MKRILLSNDKEIIVDDEVYLWLVDYNWSAHTNSSGVIYAKRVVRGLRGKTGSAALWLHRLIAGVPSAYSVSFKDANPANCTKQNIRITDKGGHQIHWTAGVGESAFVGVRWNDRKGVWASVIASVDFSLWDNEVDAARAYNIKARQVFGDGAAINEISFMTEAQYLTWPSEDDRASRKVSKHRGISKDRSGFRVRLGVGGKKAVDTIAATEQEATEIYNNEAAKHGLSDRINE